LIDLENRDYRYAGSVEINDDHPYEENPDDIRSGSPARSPVGTERQGSPPARERHEDRSADADHHATVAGSPAAVGAGRGGHLSPEQGQASRIRRRRLSAARRVRGAADVR